ncbi:ferric reduction oxidase 7, chloroplastic-like [Diospyros lotus]|uniref:ferric reduction oxidase 7, chloroplastic-like n=1 Tax=Diospyros lotus TaxID=55363 RepID=UPI00225372D3|nr:ferric reduction oxidase 7, chloroplastic-like [Diospyros lotus]
MGVKKQSLPVSTMKVILKSLMWAIFIAWVTFLFLFPLESVNSWYFEFLAASGGTVYGHAAGVFLIFSAPIIVIAFLAIAYLAISGEEEFQEKKPSKHTGFRLKTFPVIVDGPFGVITAAELIGIILFYALIVWSVCVYTVRNLNSLSGVRLTLREKSSEVLELTGLRFGGIGIFCLAFLFLPVARGSILLRLVNIPFEHGARYHVWLGHLTMTVFTLHGLFYIAAWSLEGSGREKITEWNNGGVANFAGVISLIAGLCMWVTSLAPVRRQKFELFFYTHQLYIVFVVFMALHLGDFLFNLAGGSIFLFILDRFLRFCQSRRTVSVVSATCLPSGAVELVVSKPANLQYNALSFIFLQVRELSWLQWHPFSVSSSPLDGKYHISVLIKVLGGWTEKLRDIIVNGPKESSEMKQPLQPHPHLTVSVEGPYGHESAYHLTYENLILVAGGIGISPFLAILSDILHRIKDGKPCAPRNVLVVWAVKTSAELPVLYSLDMESICPGFSDKLNLEIQTYVTQESGPQLENGKISLHTYSIGYPVYNGSGVSSLVGTGNIIWSGAYVMASTIGFILLSGLLYGFYLNPFGVTYWWYKGLLIVVCMVASPVIFGGVVIALWHRWESKTSARVVDENDGPKIDLVQDNKQRALEELHHHYGAIPNSIQYGHRPDFKEIFRVVAGRWGPVDIGVLVCGPPSLDSSVAKECRSRTLRRRSHQPIFHFNNHSFEL